MCIHTYICIHKLTIVFSGGYSFGVFGSPSCSYKQNGDEQTVRGNNIFPENKVLCIYMYIYTHIFIHTYTYIQRDQK